VTTTIAANFFEAATDRRAYLTSRMMLSIDRI